MVTSGTRRDLTESSPTAFDLAIDRALAAVGCKLHDVMTGTKFGVVTVEVRNGQVYVGGGSTVRINAQCTMDNAQ